MKSSEAVESKAGISAQGRVCLDPRDGTPATSLLPGGRLDWLSLGQMTPCLVLLSNCGEEGAASGPSAARSQNLPLWAAWSVTAGFRLCEQPMETEAGSTRAPRACGTITLLDPFRAGKNGGLPGLGLSPAEDREVRGGELPSR